MTPNRTMSSFVPGKKKKSGDSILVRGFWGDIINSPYIPFGIEIWNPEDKTKFFRKINFQRIYVRYYSIEITYFTFRWPQMYVNTICKDIFINLRH